MCFLNFLPLLPSFKCCNERLHFTIFLCFASEFVIIIFFPQASSSTQDHDMPSVEDLMHVLKVVSLGDIISRFEGLSSVHEWSSVLSLGEQQRLAFARLLLAKPKFVLLDESTSALDEANEAHLYSQIEAAGITYISIGHRSTLFKYHTKVLNISKFDLSDNRQNWELRPIDRAAKPESIPAS